MTTQEEGTQEEFPKADPKKKKPKNSKLNVVWVGTSISKSLDKKKFEKDTNANEKFVKAFSITELKL